jgi:hypothetical protein
MQRSHSEKVVQPSMKRQSPSEPARSISQQGRGQQSSSQQTEERNVRPLRDLNQYPQGLHVLRQPLSSGGLEQYALRACMCVEAQYHRNVDVTDVV